MTTMLEKFIQNQTNLLAKEKQADLDVLTALYSGNSPADLQRAGFCLLNLSVTGIRTALGGRTLMDLEAGSGQNELPFHKLTVGDIIELRNNITKNSSESSNSSSSKVQGVVYRISKSCIIVAIKQDIPDDLSDRCSLFQMSSSFTYERINKAISKLSLSKDTDLVQSFFANTPPLYKPFQKFDFFNKSLNDSQKEAIQFAMASTSFALIHGPPGTGKTHTCVELIRQLVSQGERVLVCGPSNISVDNLVERLSKTRIDIVRVGNPARVLPTVLDHSLEVRVRSCDEGKIVNDVRNDVDAALKKSQKVRNKSEKRQLYTEIKTLRQELKQREYDVIDTILNNSKVVLSTLSGASSTCIEKLVSRVGPFDTVIIDEASQSLEAECWIAILKGKRVILAGDHKQLPPTVKSSGDLEITLFDRLLKQYGSAIKRMLNIQYRSNHVIMDFSSKELYKNELLTHESVSERLLTDIDNVTDNDDTSIPLLFMDTSIAQLHETTSTSKNLSASKSNIGESQVILERVQYLVKSGVQPIEIAVISPYSAQVKLLGEVLSEFPDIEIGTVDGFQGREKCVILLSLVRSNSDGKVGFLGDERRLNVAITRSKMHLCVVGDSETMIRSGGFLKRFAQYLEECGEVRFV